jgi:hypothetical protein
MYHLRTAATLYVLVFSNMSYKLGLYARAFSCLPGHRLSRTRQNVLDVAVGDSLVCFAPIVELIVPILSRSSDGYAACLYLVGLEWHPHGFLHDSDS